MNLYIIIIFIIIIIIFTLTKLQNHDVTYVKSNIDNQIYLVRDLKDKQNASDMLAQLRKNMITLIEHLSDNKDNEYKEYKPYIEQLKDRMRNVIINESSENNGYTSYSINKGEQIVFCLRSKKDNKLHDINLLMYVALHEMAHVACPEIGHTDLFKDIFAFLTKVAIEQNLYDKIKFNIDPTEYCGMTISDSII